MIGLWMWACEGPPVALEPGEPSEPLWLLPLPAGFAEPVVPGDNPATPEKFEYGRHLFYDVRLSGNGEQACASCHLPDQGFADGLVTPVGSTGTALSRNSPGLANVAWESTYTWPNPLLTRLEDQLLVPMYGENPVELGMTGHEDEIRARLQADPVYTALAAAAFPEEQDPMSRTAWVRALATFVRGLVSSDSPYDRYLQGTDPTALSEAAQRGMDLFFSERAECYHCHGGPNLTASYTSAQSAGIQDAFFNTGLYHLGPEGDYPPGNQGLYEFTGLPADKGRFRTPSLRNVAVTAPYMHDGSIATLEEVIEHYDAGGRTLEEGPYAGVGADNPNKSPLVFPLGLTDQEKADLVAFLESLTDEAFLQEPAFGDPWPPPL
jgi:cytochrome c peroxidase